MDLQKTLTNAGRKLAPGLAATYDVLKNAQDTYNDMSTYNQDKVKQRIKEDALNRIDNKMANLKVSSQKNYKMSREVRPKSNDFSSSAARNRGLSNDYYGRYLKDMDERGKLREARDWLSSTNNTWNNEKTSIQQNLATKWRKIIQTLNDVASDIVNSPEFQYAKDSWQFQEMARINADNHIWPAWENVVYNLNTYQRTSPNWLDKWTSANSLNKAVDEYNKMLEMYWNNTTWWPKNNEWKFYWQDYMRYQDNKNWPIQYEYTVGWDKWNAILWWQRYEKQEFKFQTTSWTDLIKQMKDLTKQYNNQLELRKQNRQKRNEFVQKWQENSKEAKAFLDEYFKYNNQATETLNTLRIARDSYMNLVNSYKK